MLLGCEEPSVVYAIHPATLPKVGPLLWHGNEFAEKKEIPASSYLWVICVTDSWEDFVFTDWVMSQLVTNNQASLKWTLDRTKRPVARDLVAASTSSPVIHGHEKAQSEFRSSWMHLCWLSHPSSLKQHLELLKELMYRKGDLHVLPKSFTQ